MKDFAIQPMQQNVDVSLEKFLIAVGKFGNSTNGKSGNSTNSRFSTTLLT
jgi:hypothetical protein